MKRIKKKHTLNETFAVFLENLQGQSACNRRNYTQRLSSFLALHGETRLGQITATDVNKWLTALEERGYQEATIAGYRQAIKSFFNFCVREGAIKVSPARHIATGSFVS